MHSLIKPAALAAAIIVLLAACGGAKPPAEDGTAGTGGVAPTGQVVNVYNWSDYIDPEVIKAFERETGIKVRYDVFDSQRGARDQAARPATPATTSSCPARTSSSARSRPACSQPLDKAQLPEPRQPRPGARRSAPRCTTRATSTPSIYMWGTTGIGYDADKVKAIMPDAPLDSWQLIFDPAVLSKFKDCGVSMLDDPTDMVGTALLYLGKDPNSEIRGRPQGWPRRR